MPTVVACRKTVVIALPSAATTTSRWLRFYYGEDIEVELAEGPCVDAPVVGADTGVGEPMPANEGCGCRSGSGTESPVGTALFGFLLFVGFHARRHRLGTMRSN